MNDRLTPQQRKRGVDAYYEALFLPHDEGDAFLVRQCSDDPAVLAFAQRMLINRREQDVEEIPATPSVDADDPGTGEQGEHYGSIEETRGAVIGAYKLLQPIGEGGCGIVWLAERSHPHKQRVVLKFIKPGMDTRAVIARFEQERQALALMDHPNVAKVFDAGSTAQGRPYFVMEYVRGEPITTYCDRNRLTLRDRISLMIPICKAVQHAHQKGVIHRDIKPSNVLVSVADSMPIPKVIDFGVAKAIGASLTEKTVFTHTGQLIGTPEYMSPEQAEMGRTDIDTRADIYSLGVVIYQVLTGTLPFEPKELRSRGYAEIQRIIREVDPPKPSTRLTSLATLADVAANRQTNPKTLTNSLQRDLDWIVMKCLEKDRTRRYETAVDIAADLERHLKGDAIVAAPPSARYRFRKLILRHKWAAISALLVSIVLLIGMTATTLAAIWAMRERGIAESRAVELQTAFYRVQLLGIVDRLKIQDWDEAASRLEECSPQLRGWEWNYLLRWSDNRILRIPGAENLEAAGLDNTESKMLAITADNKVRTWQLIPTVAKCVVLDGERDFGNETWLSPISLKQGDVLAFAPWSMRALYATHKSLEKRDGPFYLVDIEQKKIVPIRIDPGNANNDPLNYPFAEFSLDDTCLALMAKWPSTMEGNEEKRHDILILNGATGELTKRVSFVSRDKIEPRLCLNSTGEWLVAYDSERAIQYETDTGDSKFEWCGAGHLQSCTFERGGTRICALTDNTLEIWDCTTGKVSQSIMLDRSKMQRFIWGLALSKSWAVAWDMVFNLDSGERVQLRGHSTSLSRLDRSQSWTECALMGSLVIENGRDGFGVWDARHLIEANSVIQVSPFTECVQFLGEGSRVISSSGSKINVHSIGTQRLVDAFDIASVDKHGSTDSDMDSHRVLAIAPGGRRIAFVCMSAPVTLKILDLDSQVVRKLFEIPDWCDCASVKQLCDCHDMAQFSHDGSRLAFKFRSMVQVFDCESAKSLLSTPHAEFMGAYCLNFDGTRLAISVNEHVSPSNAQPRVFVRVIDTISGKEIVRLEKDFAYGVRNFSFSRTGRQLYVTHYWSSGFSVWEIPSGDFKGEIGLERWGIESAVEESPDGTRLIWGGNNGTLGIADARQLRLLLELKGHSSPVYQVTFSADGTRILSASYDEIQVRDSRSGIEIYSELLMDEKSTQHAK